MIRLHELLAQDEVEASTKATGFTGDLSTVFSEEPVSLDVFVKDQKFLANPPLSSVQYEAVRYVEQIYMIDLYAQMAAEFGPYWEPVRMVNFATLEWGKGAGKDHVCRVMALRVAYLLLCLKSPLEYYGMPPQDTIHMLNVASSSNQAQQAFFIPMTRAVKRGWFKDKCEPKQNTISWEKNVESVSGHSDSESQEGLNILLGIADEIDAFKTKEEIERFRGRGQREPTKSAEAILKMIKGSSSTRFPEVFKNIRISYPRFVGSTIQRLSAEAKRDVDLHGENSRHYSSGPLATWDVNPRVAGKHVFQADYDEDPKLAAGMYECKPSFSTSPFFKNEHVWEEALVEVKRQPLEISYYWDVNHKDWEPKFDFDPEMIPIQGALYAIHGDIAIKGDRAGVAMSHVKSMREGEMQSLSEEGELIKTRVELPVVKTDFVASFGADAKADPQAREVKIRWYRQLVWQLQARGFKIGLVTFDGFQSTDTMQILHAAGIETGLQSMDRTVAPWDTLRDVVSEGRLEIPHWSPLLKQEIMGLTMTARGKVDHPANGSKDEADSLCGSVVGALEIGGIEDPEGKQAYKGDDLESFGSPVPTKEEPTRSISVDGATSVIAPVRMEEFGIEAIEPDYSFNSSFWD